MRLSFIVPTRNHAAFIRRCLDSCIAQSVPDSEIVVVDGRSSDGTQEILSSYGDRIRWTSERDSGQSEAVNKGVARSTGELVAWINSDDYYPDPGCIPAVLTTFDRHPDADIVYGDALVVTATGEPIRKYRNRSFETMRDVLVSPNGPPQPATFFRRSLFVEAGGLRPDLHYALDYELWLRMFARARRAVRLHRTLACMAFHAEAKSTYAMLPQIREAAQAKRAAWAANAFGLVDRLRIEAGIGMNLAYWLAVRSGLRQAG